MFDNSIKSRLFASLSILIVATLITIAIVSFSITKHKTKEIFDSNLVKTAKLLLSLTKHEIIEHEANDKFIIDLGLAEERELHKHEYKIHFQIWKEDYLIYNSSSDVLLDKPTKEGLKNEVIKGAVWRSFVIRDKESDITIEVVEREDVRGELIKKILETLLVPLLISFAPLLLIIWFVVNRSLIKLTKLSKDIQNISPLLLKPFKEDEDLPAEVKPLVKSLNFLLLRLEDSINKERKFINYASHELRTPLAAIKTKTQFLIKKHKNDVGLVSDLEKLLVAADRIINLSNQLLILSRIGTENQIIRKERVNLTKLLRDIAVGFLPAANLKDIDIETKKIDEDCYIEANQFHVEILLNNLFDNAIKYSTKKENISAIMQKNGEEIVISIENKGELVSKEDQKRIFDRFYRVRYHKQDGSGLGLSIVKKIADLYEF